MNDEFHTTPVSFTIAPKRSQNEDYMSFGSLNSFKDWMATILDDGGILPKFINVDTKTFMHLRNELRTVQRLEAIFPESFKLYGIEVRVVFDT